MKVRVDSDKCTGHARCNAIGPDLYRLDDLGYCRIDMAEVPPGLDQQARDGAASCPERAITLED